MPDKWRCVCGSQVSAGDRVDWLLWKKFHRDCLKKAIAARQEEDRAAS